MNDYVAYREKLNGYTLVIGADEDPTSPLEWESFVSIVFCHRRYDYRHGHAKHWSLHSAEEYVAFQKEHRIIQVPLYMLDHSGLRFRATDFSDVDPQQWDSGKVGYVFVTHEDVARELGWTRITKLRRAKIEDQLRSFIETLDQYVSGDVWCYSITNPHGEFVDSLCGMFGFDYAVGAGQDALHEYGAKTVTPKLVAEQGLGT